jgi:hypothetical protein
MLENEYRLEIQFKKVQKIRNINNINVSLRRTDFTWSLNEEILDGTCQRENDV